MPKPTKLPPVDRAASIAAWENMKQPKHNIVPKVYQQSVAPSAKAVTPPPVKAKRVRRK